MRGRTYLGVRNGLLTSVGAFATAVAFCGRGVFAQPAEFFDYGVISIPTQVHTQQSFSRSAFISTGAPDNVLTVRWARLQIGVVVPPDAFLDFTSATFGRAATLALYDNAGALVSASDRGGHGQNAPGLSFGSGGETDRGARSTFRA
jgi:hypothetical protein